MIRKVVDFWKGLFEDMAHGYSYDKNGKRLDENNDRS